ncbi:hypothetical protein BOVA604_2013 [Bacteroides ovatus]|jgi:hypothetical protein|uniref:hypothetical protein n=1 Tax=Bacteroides ovatus TaxID=28116 RepID=UPI0020A7A7B6|nr:hypothetical protein [Bacteroides ovatus]CAG9894097.1 hypothetical protein BOVA604_2013 [Bacteroides ovatus]
MTYEEENQKLKQELIAINKKIEELNELERQMNVSYSLQINNARLVLQVQKDEIERKLKEGPTRRSINRVLDKLPDAPQQVTQGSFMVKPTYSVSFSWLLMVFGICLILFLISVALFGDFDSLMKRF